MNEEMMTTKELAEKMRVTRAAISLWVKDGCPTITRKPPRFNWKAVKDWLNQRN